MIQEAAGPERLAEFEESSFSYSLGFRCLRYPLLQSLSLRFPAFLPCISKANRVAFRLSWPFEGLQRAQEELLQIWQQGLARVPLLFLCMAGDETAKPDLVPWAARLPPRFGDVRP